MPDFQICETEIEEIVDFIRAKLPRTEGIVLSVVLPEVAVTVTGGFIQNSKKDIIRRIKQHPDQHLDKPIWK